MAIHLAVLAVALLAIVAMVTQSVLSPRVSRSRVEKFARRERLPITAGNGNLVIRYLATTRRWRSAGLVAGVLVAAVSSLRVGALTVNGIAAFAGWFAGAVIAEWRMTGIRPGGDDVGAASLEPRLLRSRLRPAALALPVAMLLVALLAGLALLTQAGADVDIAALPVLAQLGLALAGLGVPAYTARHVLDRAQPSGLPPDVRAADDALRDRSLHVLAGCSVALLCYPAGTLCLQLAMHLGLLPVTPPAVDAVTFATDGAGAAGAAGVLAFLVLPAVGWLLATAPRPRRDPRPVVPQT